MPAPSLCYLCNRVADIPMHPGQAPLCPRCAADELTAAAENMGLYDADFAEDKTDPGLGPPIRLADPPPVRDSFSGCPDPNCMLCDRGDDEATPCYSCGGDAMSCICF